MAQTPEQITQEIQDGAQLASVAVAEGKDFYKSRTFYLNLLILAAHYTGYLPASAAVPVAVAGNIAMRVVTTQPLKFGSLLSFLKG